MPFQRYVEIGRVVIGTYGEEYGQLYVISDIMTPTKLLVDRPDTVRKVVSLKRFVVTDFKVEIPRLAKKAVLAKAIEEADVFNKFAASAWGQKLAKREAKAATTDFERFKAASAKMKRSAKVRKTFNQLKKAAK